MRNEVRLALKAWLKIKSVVSIKQSYLTLQQNFDKLVRRKKKLFLSTQRQELLDLQKHNPRSFLKNVKKLSISCFNKKSTIPWEVIIQGNICTNKDTILQVWKDTYYKLYNCSIVQDRYIDYYFTYINIKSKCLDT